MQPPSETTPMQAEFPGDTPRAIRTADRAANPLANARVPRPSLALDCPERAREEAGFAASSTTRHRAAEQETFRILGKVSALPREPLSLRRLEVGSLARRSR